MISSKRKTLVALTAAGALIAVFAVVWAASANPSISDPRPVISSKQTASVSAFRRPFKPNSAQRSQRRAIKRMIKRSPRASIAYKADVRRSRSVPVDGYAASVWIAPSEDGSVCTFIPDPVDGWGAGCATAEEVAAGQAMTLLGGAPGTVLADSAIVAIVVPDGAASPSVRRPDGGVSTLRVDQNVAAAVVPPGALVRSGRASISVPDQQPSALSP